MTIKQLKDKIENIPDDTDVFIHQSNDDFAYALSESATHKSIKFTDRSGRVPLVASDMVFLITDLPDYG